MLYFWMGWEAWLASRGVYLLLKPCLDFDPRWKDWDDSQITRPASSYPPYANCVPSKDNGRILAPAQDAQSRAIFLKLVNTDSDEYVAYERLLQSVNDYDASTCVGVLRPTAILRTPYNFCFVTMPRWGSIGRIDDLGSVGSIVRFMQCTSQDLHDANLLLNFYDPENTHSRKLLPTLARHKCLKDVHYGLIDFDISLCVPMETSLTDCRRSSDEGFLGVPIYQPRDVYLGEHTYNPFAYDVGALGNFYRAWFWVTVAFIPLLAPLFDRMTTHVVADRLTAAEAAVFIDEIAAQLPDSVLDMPVILARSLDCLDNSDMYWSQTDAEFIAAWASYRTPLASLATRLLDRFIQMPLGWRLVRFVRHTLRI
ncbi:hypothetical protein PYCCODRAFT_1377168 [Trametes coccinea BRFM310]|uniref:Protein kinase domain-containing protein n=1 Tax=Trametes coccinea (strain BRFM310) TaxID=1353009 RepID=A0A1Y2I8J5_TRAC3|nr:hypothetical protein PYCCODRAFT_1377168 [Trametes coccinea BRFM310]